MGQPPRTAGSGPTPWGLLGMFGVVLLAESFLANHRLDFSEPLGLEWAEAARSARRDAPACKILCFGDSLLKLGIVPRVIEGRTGKRTYNLAVRGGQASSSAILLQRALDSGARPSLIVVDFFQHLNRKDSRHNLNNWAYLNYFKEGAELAYAGRDGTLFGTFFLGKIFPSVRGRFPLRTACLTRLNGRNLSEWSQGHFLRNRRLNQGAVVLPSHPEEVLKSDPSASHWIFQDCHYDPVNLGYIRRFFALAASHNIPVFWVVPPVVPSLQEWCVKNGHDAYLTQFLRSWQSEYHNLVVIDGRRAHYDPKVYNDPVHLGREGAYVLSYEVGEIVRRYPLGDAAAPRWVELPRYRARPVDIPLEDVEQSRHVWQNDPQVRRR